MGRSMSRRGEDLLGGGPAFALDEAAGELAGGVGLLAVVDDEREEVAAVVGLAFDGGDQDHGVAVADDDGAVGLLGEFAGFEDEVLAPNGRSTRHACTDRSSLACRQEDAAADGRSNADGRGPTGPSCDLLPQAQPADDGQVAAAVRCREGR